jgi:hypothetical protein
MYADQPVHAFYDDQNRVQLILANLGDNHRMVGPNLDVVQPEQLAGNLFGYTDMRPCDNPVTLDHHNNVIHEFFKGSDGCGSNGERCEPGSHHHFEEVDSVWTPDGHTLSALIHNEFHGEAYGGSLCSTGPPNCYYSTITYAQSQDSSPTARDSGATYSHVPSPPDHLVASLPYQYEADRGGIGYASPTNILKIGSAWVAFFIARGCDTRSDGSEPCHKAYPTDQPYAPAQRTGTCAMRTFDISNPNSWQAWDGGGFNVTLTDPYNGRYVYTPEIVSPLANIDPPSRHVCAPLAGAGLFGRLTPRSLVYDRSSQKYVLVGSLSQSELGRPNGIYYSFNDTLTSSAGHLWSDPRKIMESPEDNQAYCANPSSADPQAVYPSIIDPTPPDDPLTTTEGRNFERIDDDDPINLYFTQYKFCPLDGTNASRRDLVKVKIKFNSNSFLP